MELKLQLCVFILHIQASLALWQHMTVMKGQTVLISCPITNALQINMEWRNPEGNILFFKHTNDLVSEVTKSKRHKIHKLSESEFTISISSVTFKDGGNYTCSQYYHPMTEKTVELTVLDHPKIKKTKHQGRFDIKCTAEGNHYPSQIFWKLNQGPEILAHPQVLHEGKTYISTAIISIQSVKNGVTVTCLVRHPDLHTQPLIDFVKVKENSKKSCNKLNSPTAQPQQSTGPQRTTSWLRYDVTTAHLATKGWTPVSEATEEITTNNHTKGNMTGTNLRTAGGRNSSLLIFLVTCLILALLVVVIFFGIKMRRVHIIWQRENEDTDPSEESSKSKSSPEERNSQGQGQRGLFNTVFTQYMVEETPATTSVINTAAMAATDSLNRERNSQPQSSRQTGATSDRDKETSL